VYRSIRMSLLVALFLSVPSLYAQPADPSGHWEGAIQAPGKDVKIEIDLATKDGKLAGTFGTPEQNESGFPLSNVAAQGTSVSFEIKATSGGGTFKGALSADGKTMSGDFITAHGMSIGFSLTRTGEARVEALLPSPPVAKALEGKWTGTLDANGVPHQIGLKMANHPDGTATGSVISSEGVEINITRITNKGSSLTLEVRNVGGSYAGTLNADGTELAGTWTQGKFVAPLTFRRAATK
jgi:hypothetical protein